MLSVGDGELVLLVSSKGNRFIFPARTDEILQTHHGVIEHNSLIGKPWGSLVESHLGVTFYLFEPALTDILLNIRRRSQIVFPKDIGYILTRLAIVKNMKVLEAGSGSGAFTTALAWAVGPHGQVISYDRRPDMLRLAAANLAYVGLAERVTFHQLDISSGFGETEADAVFLDLPDPEFYLEQVAAALRGGGTFGAILPTANQVSSLVDGLLRGPFALVDVCEIMLRFYKTIPQRIRPVDRMVAHTGYLLFARRVLEVPQGRASFQLEADQEAQM